jgi:dihydrofolate reductase
MPRKARDSQAKNAEHPNRRVRYAVAMSLDGFIAGPNGEADWIIMDSSGDAAAEWEAFYSQFDTMVMGRKTYEVVKAAGGAARSRVCKSLSSRALCGKRTTPTSRPPATRKG